jgi:hypothetical protein
MKRIAVFVGLVALLGGWWLFPYMADDADAQASRMRIRPYTTPYLYGYKATSVVSFLVTPTSNLRGCEIQVYGDSAIYTQVCSIAVYGASGDSATVLAYPHDINHASAGSGVLTFKFPNVRVTGFRLGFVNETVTSPVMVYITGWY